jgi:hemolysin activation/secretion protein
MLFPGIQNNAGVKETVQAYGLLFTVPIVDRLSSRFALFLGGGVNHSYTELLGTGFSFCPGAQNGTSKVTQVYGGLDWLLRGSSSVTDLRLTYCRGIDALGATTETVPPTDNFNPNPTGATAIFGLEQLQFVYIQRLNGFSLFSKVNDRAQFLIRATGQISQDPLLSVMKMPVGGVDTVRGFPENSFVRDNGAAATLELQLPVPGYRATPHWSNFVFAPFVDYGRTWDKVNTQPGSGYDTTVPRYMASAGIGLLWNPFNGFDATVYWGRDIANNFDGYDPRNYVPHDLQYDGISFAVNFVYRW